MRNLRITLEYDGTRYRGWQIQKNSRSVGGDFAAAIGSVLGETPPIYAAGRTDAGVHAMGQVVSCRTASSRHLLEIQRRLNDALPADINVLEVEEVPLQFHARHDAVSRTYRYQVSRRRTAFGKRYVWWVRSRLDDATLADAAAAILAARTFGSYCERDPHAEEGAAPGNRCVILGSEWVEEGPLLIYKIQADRFLWKMVRRLVGTMVAEALGEIPRGSAARWLKEESKEPARLTAPPSGLFLESVQYPPPGAARPRPRPHEGRAPRKGGGR